MMGISGFLMSVRSGLIGFFLLLFCLSDLLVCCFGVVCHACTLIF